MTDDAPPASGYRLLFINGSLRSGSTHGAVLKAACNTLPPGVTAAIYGGLATLPHFNPDDETSALPAMAADLRRALAQTDGVLFCTPEYAGTLPGSFKNLLDWTVGEGLYAKPVAWINAAPQGGAEGAHRTLKIVLGYVSADLVEEACANIPVRRDDVGPDGAIVDPEINRAIGQVLATLVKHLATKSASQGR